MTIKEKGGRVERDELVGILVVERAEVDCGGSEHFFSNLKVFVMDDGIGLAGIKFSFRDDSVSLSFLI